MKKKLLIILAIGLIVRVVLAFTTYHSDVQPFSFAGRVLKEGNWANFYDYLWNLPEDSPILKIYPRYLFNYPPAVYFGLGLSSILTTWVVGPEVNSAFLFNLASLLGDLRLNLLLFLLKLPYFAFDLLTAFLLMSFFKKKSNKLLAFSFWMFNPVNLYATYMIGQFDIIPTFFIVLCLYLIIKNKSKISSRNLLLESVVLGLGGAFKIFPLILLIPLASLKTRWFERIKIVVVGLLTYIATIIPFVFSKGFRATALMAGQTMKSLYSQIPLSGGEAIILYLAFNIFLFLFFMDKKARPEHLWKRFFVILILFFVFTHYHLQWFLWLTPLLIIDLVKSKLKHGLLVALVLVSFTGLITFFEPGLSVWLFSPVFPQLYGLPGIWSLLGIAPDFNLFRSIFQTIFVAAGFYYLYLYFQDNAKAPRK